MNITYYILLLFLVMGTSCSHNSSQTNIVLSHNEAKRLSEMLSCNDSYDIIYSTDNVYILGSKNNLYKTNLKSIYQWYKLGHIKNYLSLSDYLYSIFNQALKDDDSISIRSMKPCGQIDLSLLKQYKRLGINGIIEKYCKSSFNGKYLILNGSFSESKKETIAYLFFTNRYMIGESDVIVRITFSPFPKDWGRSVSDVLPENKY